MPTAVFPVDLDLPVGHSLAFATLVKSMGDGYTQRANLNQAYSRADGEGGVTSYKGQNSFRVSLDHLAHVNADSTQMANKLWAFYKARLGGHEAFYFYNPAEAPVADLTGVSTTGRYLVIFSQQSLTREQFALLLFRGQIELLEVRA